MSRHVRMRLSSVSSISHQAIIPRLAFGITQMEKEDRGKKKPKKQTSSVRKEITHIVFKTAL